MARAAQFSVLFLLLSLSAAKLHLSPKETIFVTLLAPDYPTIPEALTTFKYGHKNIRVWETSVQKSVPPQLQFSYEAILVPVGDEKQSIIIGEKRSGENWITSFDVILDDNKAKELAFISIQLALRKSAGIFRENVSSYPLGSNFFLKLPGFIINYFDQNKVEWHEYVMTDNTTSFIRVEILSPTFEIAQEISTTFRNSPLSFDIRPRTIFEKLYLITKDFQDFSKLAKSSGGISMDGNPENSPLNNSCQPAWELNCDPNGCFCYHVFPSLTNWKTAENNCKSSGANLVSIHNSDQQNVTRKFVERLPNQEAWIGLNHPNVKQKFNWTDGSPVNYTFLAKGQPDNYNDTEVCGSMLIDSKTEIIWQNSYCSKSLASVCKKNSGPILEGIQGQNCFDIDKLSSKVDSLFTSVRHDIVHLVTFFHDMAKKLALSNDGKTCEKSWTKACTFGVCHCYKVLTSKSTWKTAVKNCKDVGANLASIHDADEALIIQKLVIAAGGTDTWIGLNDRAVEGKFEWSDGTKTGYFAWREKQPDDWKDNEDCVHIVPGALFNWNDGNCRLSFMSACKKKI